VNSSDVDQATAYVRKPDLNAVRMDGELVMMGHEQGEYYGLRDVAASLWEHLAEPRTLDDLCGLVAEEYDVTPAECRADNLAFLNQLLDRGLIQPVG
jgi:hypothetical protein